MSLLKALRVFVFLHAWKKGCRVSSVSPFAWKFPRGCARINYWFNGSMTKNVKDGLSAQGGDGMGGLRPVRT